MSTLIKNVRFIDPEAGIDEVTDLCVGPNGVRKDENSHNKYSNVIEGTGLWAVPGLLDLQVHFRQPGFEHKETIESGSAAALAGGITAVVVMPNTHPPLDTPDSVRFEAEESQRVGGIDILVAAAATKGLEGKENTDAASLKAAGAVALTDDGWPVLDDAVMEQSLRDCAANDLLFMQHAEDTRMSQHAPMTASPTQEKIGVLGQPADAEGEMVIRDVALVEKTGARYHVLHCSTERSLNAIREGKKKGLRVTCEASPHHLLLSTEDCADADPNFKMNPPLRSPADRAALVRALADGTVDAVATDHAPHAAAEKARGFVDAPFGVIGVETAFAALLSFVHDGTISDVRAVELMTSSPAKVIGLQGQIGTTQGEEAPAHLCLIDPNRSWTVGLDDLKGKSTNSPFLGRTFKGKVLRTWLRGEERYRAD